MYLLRCTMPLRRAAVRHLPAARPGDRSDTRLGDWFATRLNSGRQRYILATSSATLLSVVVPARDPAGLPGRIAAAVAELLREVAAPAAARDREVGRMAEARIAATDDRRVLGAMGALRVDADWELRDLAYRPGRTLHYVNVRLAATPCGLLDYRTPAELARQLLS